MPRSKLALCATKTAPSRRRSSCGARATNGGAVATSETLYVDRDGAAVERAGIEPGSIDDVYFGCANQAGEDNRNVARMALLLAEYGYVIKDGVIHIEGPAEQMISDDAVRLSYLGGTVADRDRKMAL